MKITFLGDIMCELPVLKAAKRETGYDFSGVFAPSKKLLAKSDFVIGNLETPLAGEAAGYSESHLAFNAPDEYADALKAAGVSLISTANNHTFDRGYEGAWRTIKVLDEKGIPHTGSFLPGTQRPEAYYAKVGDTTLAVIAYTYGTNYKESGGDSLAEGEYAGTVNLLCHQDRSSYLPGVYRSSPMPVRKLKNVFKNPDTRYQIAKALGYETTYSRDDDNLEGKTDTTYIAQLQADIRAAREKADLVLFYPHVGGQFNPKPGAFTEYVIDKAVEAGAHAVVATHSHIPQKLVVRDGVPCAYCLGNWNMNPESYLAMPEILTNYGYALHLYVKDGKIQKVTFSMMKNHKGPDGQIASWPVDLLYSTLGSDAERKALQKEIKHLYGRITGRALTGDIVREEYDMPERLG